jgi:hypothetical protein
MRSFKEEGAGSPAERARSLVFARILSIPAGTDLAAAACELRDRMLLASKTSNGLRVHVVALLDEILDCTSAARRSRST